MKDCLIIGNKNAVTTKYVFPLLKDRVLKTGYTVPRDYTQPEWCETKSLNGLTRWFTTLPVTDKEPLVLTARYSPEKYPKYDNYDAIEVGALKDIPFDYSGVMGVPISFLHKYNPEQFEIVGIASGSEEVAGDYYLGVIPTIKYDGGKARAYVGGKALYSRILIRKRTA